MDGSFERLRQALSGRYAVERELGSGGMATVFLAEERHPRRHVAIKVLDPTLAAVLGPERFLREVDLASKLTHPHILPIFAADEAEGLLYYVMPYVEGESLRERLARERQLPLDDALQIAREVADALSYAHSQGVIHRDIKPENILLESGHAVVADFGIARAITAAGGERLTETGIALGTPAYMSPEQAAGSKDLDGRSDLYSLGCVLYEMLAGQQPFLGPTVESVVHQHLTAPPPIATTVRSAVPAPLAQTIVRALAKAPADRFASAAQFLESLRTGSAEVAAAPRRARVRRLAPYAVVGGLVALAAVVWLVIARRVPTLDRQRVVVAPFRNATGDVALGPFGRLVSDWITQGLVRADIPGIVSSATTLGPALAAGSGDLSALARAARAGTVVSGTYFLQGDSLQLQAEIVDAATGRVVTALIPVAGPRRAPLAAVDPLRQRVMAALAGRVNPRLAAWGAIAFNPPTYDAYLAHAAGVEAYARDEYVSARDQFHRAVALDSTFTLALLWEGLSEWNIALFDAAAARRTDAIIGRLDGARDRLSRYEQCRLDRLKALNTFDWAKSYAAGLCAADASGGSDEDTREVALDAMRLNRPREAVRILERLDPTRGWIRDWAGYWRYLGDAYHMLGDYRAELRASRRGAAAGSGGYWTRFVRLRALAAVGRQGEIDTVLEESVRGSPPFGIGWLVSRVGRELVGHGHREAGLEVLRRGVALLRSSGPLSGDSVAVSRRFAIAQLLHDAGDLSGCAAGWGTSTERRLLDVVGAYEFPCPPALLAAARGDRTEAERLLEAGDRDARRLPVVPRTFQVMARARVAALLGDRERAVEVLRQVLPILGFSDEFVVWHADVDLDSLRDYRPFQDLLRPRD